MPCALLRAALRFRYQEIAADLAGKMVVDFTVAGHRRNAPPGTVEIDGMAGAFAKQRHPYFSRWRTRSVRFIVR